MKAMILAAGLGTRLLPHTRQRPKPLFPVLNRPLLLLTVNRLREAGFGEIVINAHHLREQIKSSLAGAAGITVQEEEEILGTGGGLQRALPHFDRDPVLVVNGDIYHSIDYREVYRYHRAAEADATLVLHDCFRFNSVTVDEAHRLTGFRGNSGTSQPGERTLAFTGIHVINPAVLATITPGANSSIIACYEKLILEGGTVQAFLATGHYWTDMGTPADYLRLHAGLLAGTVPVYGGLGDRVSERFAGLNQAVVAEDVTLLDWVCLGHGARIGAGATLQRAVVWDEVHIPAGAVIRDAIVSS
jgi:mannose-1-phosphate guanylyltransferase